MISDKERALLATEVRKTIRGHRHDKIRVRPDGRLPRLTCHKQDQLRLQAPRANPGEGTLGRS